MIRFVFFFLVHGFFLWRVFTWIRFLRLYFFSFLSMFFFPVYMYKVFKETALTTLMMLKMIPSCCSTSWRGWFKLHSFSIPWFFRVGFYMAMIFWWGSCHLVLDVELMRKVLCFFPQREEVDVEDEVFFYPKGEKLMRKMLCIPSPRRMSGWERWCVRFPQRRVVDEYDVCSFPKRVCRSTLQFLKDLIGLLLWDSYHFSSFTLQCPHRGLCKGHRF